MAKKELNKAKYKKGFDYDEYLINKQRSQPNQVSLSVKDVQHYELWREQAYTILMAHIEVTRVEVRQSQVIYMHSSNDVNFFLKQFSSPLWYGEVTPQDKQNLIKAFDEFTASTYETEHWSKATFTSLGYETKNWSYWRQCAKHQGHYAADKQPKPKWESVTGEYQGVEGSKYRIDEAWQGKEINAEKASDLGLIRQPGVSPQSSDDFDTGFNGKVYQPAPKPLLRQAGKPSRKVSNKPRKPSRRPKQRKCGQLVKFKVNDVDAYLASLNK